METGPSSPTQTETLKYSSPVASNTAVAQGAIIGSIGRTGGTQTQPVTGPHLHLGMRSGGVFVDPIPFFVTAPAPDPPGEDVPFLNAIDWTTPTPITDVIGDATWTRMPRSSPTLYDVAPTFGGPGLWHLEVNFYVSGLALGEVLVVRVGAIDTPTHYTQEYYQTTIEGTPSGSTRKQYTSTIRIRPSTSVVIEGRRRRRGWWLTNGMHAF